MPLTIDLSGQTVLVTGASRGIGRAIAETCAAAGATVGVHYASSRTEAETLADRLGGRAFQADLERDDAPDRLFAEAVAAFRRVDGLVCNAGIYEAAPLDAHDWATSWDRTMAVNLRAVGLLCRAAIRHFQAHGGGRIVTVSSRAAFRGDTPDHLAYAASKAGVVALTRSIARGFGREGIVAFSVAPGFTRTGMADTFIAEHGEAAVTADLALDRLTEPGDIAPSVAFLLSGMADHATGATLDLNAGSYVR